MKGLDYSWARPNPAEIKARGYDFVCRYLSYDAGKNISPQEAQDLLNNNLGIILVWESTATRALAGKQAGIEDAWEALNQANAIGQPNYLPIYMAVDFDATESQQGAIDDYLRGAAQVFGSDWVGVYGGFYIVKRCLDHGTAKWGWQTLAWSGGQVDPRVHIYQNGGTDFNNRADINEARQDNFGQWVRNVAPPAPAPEPAPVPEPTPTPEPPAPTSEPTPKPSPEPPVVVPEPSKPPKPVVIQSDPWIINLFKIIINWFISLRGSGK
jgi:hypothetical protein